MNIKMVCCRCNSSPPQSSFIAHHLIILCNEHFTSHCAINVQDVLWFCLFSGELHFWFILFSMILSQVFFKRCSRGIWTIQNIIALIQVDEVCKGILSSTGSITQKRVFSCWSHAESHCLGTVSASSKPGEYHIHLSVFYVWNTGDGLFRHY